MVTPTRSLPAGLSIVPRRLWTAVVIFVLLAAVALTFVPSSVAFAGMAPGGSKVRGDNPNGFAPGGSDGMAPGGSNPHGMAPGGSVVRGDNPNGFAPGGSDGMAPGGSNPHGMTPGGSDARTAWWAYIY